MKRRPMRTLQTLRGSGKVYAGDRFLTPVFNTSMGNAEDGMYGIHVSELSGRG